MYHKYHKYHSKYHHNNTTSPHPVKASPPQRASAQPPGYRRCLPLVHWSLRPAAGRGIIYPSSFHTSAFPLPSCENWGPLGCTLPRSSLLRMWDTSLPRSEDLGTTWVHPGRCRNNTTMDEARRSPKPAQIIRHHREYTSVTTVRIRKTTKRF